jgi:hypothetical protein
LESAFDFAEIQGNSKERVSWILHYSMYGISNFFASLGWCMNKSLNINIHIRLH